ncbi:mating alpha-pheromone PpgA [Aspergillus undulatus]|uniref:mating alpha-pheromone PpgA n=1 Tax=Aspergillus undulatus TaxID=1810928 RepID=UPI003CCD3F9E
MKLAFVVLAALAATTVRAAPQRGCYFPGEICGKTKRAFDAIDEVKRSAASMADAQLSLNRWCRVAGQVCGEAKHAIEAIDNVKRSAGAVADAMAFLDGLTEEDYAQIQDAE